MFYKNIKKYFLYILLVESISVIIFFYKIRPLGFLLFAISLAGLYFTNNQTNEKYVFNSDSLFNRFMLLLSKDSKVIPLVNIFGFLILSLLLIIEGIFLDQNFNLSSKLLLIFSLLCMFYNSNYIMEFNYSISFFSIMLLIYSLPYSFTFLYSKITHESAGNPEFIFDENLLEFILVIPLKNILTILGFNVFNNGLLLSFPNYDEGITSSVDIVRSCTGIHSVYIFSSLFLTLILNTTQKLNINHLILFLFGVTLSYVANLFRMTLIVITGIYYGMDMLLFVHEYLGWLIFTIWLTAFFSLFGKFFDLN